MNRRRVVLYGAAALGTYVVAAVATLGLSGRPLLPLFEGIGPPPAYQWVNPPPALAAGNSKPHPVGTDIGIEGGKSSQAGAITPDSQLIVNFSANALPAHASDNMVHATITPLDPATLGPVPSGLVADGNAYRVELTYKPSDTPLDAVVGPCDIALSAPNPGQQVLLYSSDGQSWTKLPTQSIGSTSTVFSTFTHPGWYLVGASPTAVVPGQHNNGLSTAVIAVLVAVLAIALAVTPVGFRAVRKRATRRRSERSARPGPPRAGPAKRTGRR